MVRGAGMTVAFGMGPIPTENQFPCQTLVACLALPSVGAIGNVGMASGSDDGLHLLLLFLSVQVSAGVCRAVRVCAGLCSADHLQNTANGSGSAWPSHRTSDVNAAHALPKHVYCPRSTSTVLAADGTVRLTADVLCGQHV